MADNRCPTCNEPAQVWADHSDGVTVNFACDNPACKAGKGPWDTESPTKLPLGTCCGIHGDSTHSGRCASCDAERHVRPEEPDTEARSLRGIERANALEWGGEDIPS